MTSDETVLGGGRFGTDHDGYAAMVKYASASEHEAATIDVGGACIMFAMTSVGDGFFPVHVELDAAGAPAAIQVTVHGDQDRPWPDQAS